MVNLITFSTLACPHWSTDTVIQRAMEFGYDGIEWRGGPEGHVQPVMSSAQRAALRKASSAAGLMALAVTAYTSFVSPFADERQSQGGELRRYADLAAEIGAGYIRVFLGELPEDTTINSSIYENIAEALSRACEYAETVGVKLAVEPHDTFTRSATVAPVLERTTPESDLRVIWDLGNTFSVGEDPVQGFDVLKDRLAYVQVKDGTGRGATWQLCALGEGNVPLGQAFELLSSHGYGGAFSVEWEYAWHPELDPPEVALPAALRTVRQLLAAAQRASA